MRVSHNQDACLADDIARITVQSRLVRVKARNNATILKLLRVAETDRGSNLVLDRVAHVLKGVNHKGGSLAVACEHDL